MLRQAGAGGFDAGVEVFRARIGRGDGKAAAAHELLHPRVVVVGAEEPRTVLVRQHPPAAEQHDAVRKLPRLTLVVQHDEQPRPLSEHAKPIHQPARRAFWQSVSRLIDAEQGRRCGCVREDVGGALLLQRQGQHRLIEAGRQIGKTV